MGRLYQIFGAACVLSVVWYCWRQCAGLRFRRSILAGTFLTFLFIFIHFKSISAPIITYGALGLFAIPAIIYGLLYRYELLLIATAIYLPYSSILPADFGGAQQALNGTNILLVALVVGLVVGRMGGRGAASHRVLKNATYLVVAFIFLVAISFLRASLYFGSVYYTQMAADFKRYLDPMVIFLFVIWVASDRGIIKILFSILLIVVIMAVFLGLLEWVNLGFGTYAEYKRRLGSLNMQPNVFGAFISYYACLFLGLFLTNRGSLSGRMMILPFLLCFRILIPTNSRGAWISFPPALFTVAWFRSPFLFAAVLLLLIVPFALNPGLIPETITYRFEEATKLEESDQLYEHVPAGLGMIGESQSISMRTRYRLLETGLKVWRQDVFFGQGYGTFSYRVREYTGGAFGGTAHNGWLKMLVEMGLLSIGSLAALLGYFFWASLQIYRRERDHLLRGCALGYLGSIPALLVANLTGERFSHIDLMAVFWIMSACLVRLRAIQVAEKNQG